MKIYLNGQLQEKDSLEEVFEPGFLFGWGCFETMRAYKGKIPFLKEHINRLNKGIALLGLAAVDLQWEQELSSLLEQNSLQDAYVRITAYKKRQGTGVIVYADKFGYYTPEIYDKGFSCLISSYRRDPEDVGCKAKTLSYLQNRLSWFQAQKEKKSEAIVLNQKGTMAGGARSNLFIVKEGKVFTPSISCGAFDGITRKAVFDIVESIGVESEEKELLPEDLFSAEEVFLTSALLEVMPLVECEGKQISQGKPGEFTRQVHSQYKKLLEEA